MWLILFLLLLNYISLLFSEIPQLRYNQAKYASIAVEFSDSLGWVASVISIGY